MTIALSLKVNDGVILAADSASTMLALDAEGRPLGVENVYANANKVFNLRKGLPIGAVTWGLGSIGVASVETLMKDFRAMLTVGDRALDPGNYTIEQVAQAFYQFVYQDRYVAAFDAQAQKPAMGFIVAGYSSGEGMAEDFLIEVAEGGWCAGPQRLQPK